MQGLHDLLAPWFLYVKALHVLAASLWSFSTAVAWTHYLKPALAAAARRPDDGRALERRDDFLRRFDKGVVIEHVAFAVLVATAVLLIWLGSFRLDEWSYVTALLAVGIVVIVPMELVDIYISHVGGTLVGVRRDDEPERHARLVEQHRRFLAVTEPLVMVLVPLLFVLAIAKPF